MKKSIAVIGSGFVGGSLITVFAERGFDVFAYDKAGTYAPGARPLEYDLEHEVSEPTRVVKLREVSVANLVKLSELRDGFTKIYFVCVPTPMNPDGSCNTTIVEAVLSELASVAGERIAVVKSTIPPGSTETWNKRFEGTGLKIVFCPEFLRESSALEDTRNPSRIVMGGPRPWINRVKNLFQSAFPTTPVIKTSSTNAELTKYVTNCFLAMKISFANEIFQLCEALDEKGLNADYDRVIECATLDERLGKSHWRVPSFESDEKTGEPLYGFSLSCFPKDINALLKKEEELGVEPTMLRATWQKNVEVRPQQDWRLLIGRAVTREEKE